MPNFDLLDSIIQDLEPLQARAEACLSEYLDLLSEENMDATFEQFCTKIDLINSEIAKIMPRVAEITNNSLHNVMSYAPRERGVYWFQGDGGPATFMMNVQKYGSFDSNYWSHCKRYGKRVNP